MEHQKPAGSVSRLDGSKISISEDVRLVLHDEDGEYPEIEYIPQCPPGTSFFTQIFLL